MSWDTSDRSSRLPADWSRIRRAVMRRDRAMCHVCGMSGADEVDHLVPGDDHSQSNLAPIHQRVWPHCHRYKSSREGVAARAALRAQRLRPRERHPGLIEKGVG